MPKDIRSKEVHIEQEIINCYCWGRYHNSITGLEWIIESIIITLNVARFISDISVIAVIIIIIIIGIGAIARVKAKELIATKVDVTVEFKDGNQVEK